MGEPTGPSGNALPHQYRPQLQGNRLDGPYPRFAFRRGVRTHGYRSAGGAGLIGLVSLDIDDRIEGELSKLGLMPLIHRVNTDVVAFMGTQTLRRPLQFEDQTQRREAAMRISLSNVFPALRFAQYLKVIARDKISGFTERKDMQAYLQTWINQYVDENPAVSSEVQKARQPLAGAEVQIDEVREISGEYEARKVLKPSYQVEGMDPSLRIVTKLPWSRG